VSILKIAKLGHPVLLKKSSEIKEFATQKLKSIIYDMCETMIDYNGIGLAAPQVHISKRIIVFRNPDIDEGEKIQVTPLINPFFKPITDEKDNEWEGCLSIPRMQGLVSRYKKITYYGFDLNGNKIENEVEGLHARVIQHEIDHLDGILYTNRLADNKAFGFEREIIEFWKNEKNSKQ
tara:strand:- start:28 stop:561 length:534 start_codon:yes stop_codon:yes gene_type:complete